jgi:DNA-binding CsgD family transcriptional regulator
MAAKSSSKIHTTRREKEVLNLLPRHTAGEIARKLGISLAAIHNICASLRRKKYSQAFLRKNHVSKNSLSPRQIEVMALVEKKVPYKKIAATLGLKVQSCINCAYAARKKLQLQKALEMARVVPWQHDPLFN